mmetsp:Transcript_16000/g.24220  ORF Transcript_16000/g.24220 Transcript_16000/m.24220 type:complete len:195 (+) Transcript_16000:88-672(+)
MKKRVGNKNTPLVFLALLGVFVMHATQGLVVCPRISNQWLPRPAFHQSRLSMTADDIGSLEPTARLKRFLEDCAFLGPVRFIVRNEAAILESVGLYEKVAYKDTENGQLASLMSDDKSFECHVYINKVGRIEMVSKEAKDQERGMMYITRVFDKDSQPMLSMLLHYDKEAGGYEEGAVEWWFKMLTVFGETQVF